MITLLLSAVNLLLSHYWLLLFGLLALVYRYSTRNFNHWKERGIAGPKPYPFIGNFFSFSKPIPQLYSEYLRKYGKYFGVFRSNKPVLFISDPEVIKRIMVKDFPLFRNRTSQPVTSKIGQYNLVNARDEQWKRIRGILTPMFTSSKLRKMESQMRSCTQSVLDTFERYTKAAGAGEEVTLVAHDAMASFTMDVIAKCAFATDTNAHVEADNVFVRNAREMMTFNLARFLVIPFMPVWLYRKLRDMKTPFFYMPSADFFLKLCKHLISERQSARKQGTHQHNDMLQLMVNAEYEQQQQPTANGTAAAAKEEEEIFAKEDLLEAHHVNVGTEEMETEKKLFKNIIGTKRLSEDEILAQAIVFFLAGYETTANALSSILYELAVNPDIQQRLYEEIQEAKAKDSSLSYQTVQSLPYLDAVISEGLRMYPPAMSVGRECNAEEGYHIPEINFTLKKGESVTFPVVAIHHLEEYWKQPEVFNPDRFLPENRHLLTPYTYLPFGGGPRSCIGMRFALTEAKLGLANIIDRYQITRTPKTPKKLKIILSFPLLKTEPIYIGVKKR